MAANLAPALAGRLLWSINMDVLSDRVLEMVVEKVATSEKLVEAVTAHLMKRLESPGEP